MPGVPGLVGQPGNPGQRVSYIIMIFKKYFHLFIKIAHINIHI